jgi:hypothetical protein
VNGPHLPCACGSVGRMVSGFWTEGCADASWGVANTLHQRPQTTQRPSRVLRFHPSCGPARAVHKDGRDEKGSAVQPITRAADPAQGG